MASLDAMAGLRAQLERELGPERVLSDALGRMLYEYDGGVDRALPDLVVFPKSREEVVAVMCLTAAAGVPLVARGRAPG